MNTFYCSECFSIFHTEYVPQTCNIYLQWQVSLPVVRRFIESVTENAVGTSLIRGVRPDQQLVKVRL